jgi:hypothetical protein
MKAVVINSNRALNPLHMLTITLRTSLPFYLLFSNLEGGSFKDLECKKTSIGAGPFRMPCPSNTVAILARQEQ